MKRILPFVLMLASAACGSSSPAAPSTAATAPVNPASLNITGSWGETVGGTLYFELQQTGTAVTGTSGFSDRNAVFGSYDAKGTVSGTMTSTGLTMTEVYQLISSSNGPAAIAGCVETVTSNWTFPTATQMTGAYSQTDTCNGTVVFTKSGVATIVKTS